MSRYPFLFFCVAATRGRIRCRSCPALMGATHPCVSAEFHGHPLQGVPRSYPAPTRGTMWHPASALGLQAVPSGVCKHAVPAVLLEEELLYSCQGSFRISRHPQPSRIRRAAAPSAGAVLMPCCRAGRGPRLMCVPLRGCIGAICAFFASVSGRGEQKVFRAVRRSGGSIALLHPAASPVVVHRSVPVGGGRRACWIRVPSCGCIRFLLFARS